jgi:ABC-type multidrug transport system ATPase subunit
VAILNKGKIIQMGTAAELSIDLFKAQELKICTSNSIPIEIIDDMQKFSFIKNFTINGHDLILKLENIDDNTPDVMEFLQQNKIRIVEVVRTKHSLEEIYLSLMSQKYEKVGEWN